MIVLDACVLIALTDRSNTWHDEARQILARPGGFAICVLTGAEIMVYPVPPDLGTWQRLFADLGIDVWSIEAADMPLIADERRTSGLRMPDALVLWLARRLDAAVATFDQTLATRARQFGVAVLP